MSLAAVELAISTIMSLIAFPAPGPTFRKKSDDHDLKDKLSEVFDSVLELKEVIGNLRDENADLQKRLQIRDALKWDSATKLYFVEGDPDPFCPACMDANGAPIRLQPFVDDGVIWRYDCKVCKNHYTAGSRPRTRHAQTDPSPWS
jgi:hypothetical protein